MVIEIHLDYSSGVTCFDPEKVMLRLLDEFPEANTDWKDHTAAELQNVTTFVKGWPCLAGTWRTDDRFDQA
jgi:hypothetical protein